jgi:hypothetical protein
MRIKLINLNSQLQTRLIMKNEELKSRASCWVKNYKRGTMDQNKKVLVLVQNIYNWKELKPGRNFSNINAEVLAKEEEHLAIY